VLEALPPAKTLIADIGYDSTAFRQALVTKGIEPCIPSSRPENPLSFRQGALPSAPQGREPLRQAQGLAPHCGLADRARRNVFDMGVLPEVLNRFKESATLSGLPVERRGLGECQDRCRSIKMTFHWRASISAAMRAAVSLL